VRKAKEGKVTADIFAFLTCEPNAEAARVYPKAMPVNWRRPKRHLAARSLGRGRRAAAPAFGRSIVNCRDRREGISGIASLINTTSGVTPRRPECIVACYARGTNSKHYCICTLRSLPVRSSLPFAQVAVGPDICVAF
jgi:hypothetical protein